MVSISWGPSLVLPHAETRASEKTMRNDWLLLCRISSQLAKSGVSNQQHWMTPNARLQLKMTMRGMRSRPTSLAENCTPRTRAPPANHRCLRVNSRRMLCPSTGTIPQPCHYLKKLKQNWYRAPRLIDHFIYLLFGISSWVFCRMIFWRPCINSPQSSPRTNSMCCIVNLVNLGNRTNLETQYKKPPPWVVGPFFWQNFTHTPRISWIL